MKFVGTLVIGVFLLSSCSDSILSGRHYISHSTTIVEVIPPDQPRQDSAEVNLYTSRKNLRFDKVPSSTDPFPEFELLKTDAGKMKFKSSLRKKETFRIDPADVRKVIVNKKGSFGSDKPGEGEVFASTFLLDGERKETFKYHTLKGTLQALSVPIKIRPALSGMDVLDSFPSQVSTGLNFALSGGLLWEYKKQLVGEKEQKRVFSIGAGGMLGFSTVTLKKQNTSPDIRFEKSSLVLSPGLYVMGGLDRVHVGAALGWDAAIGSHNVDWVYHWKHWYGIIVGLDLIKAAK
ncbi:MAG: hypothetical protein AAGC47_13690 [Bacteroidota bacterium]